MPVTSANRDVLEEETCPETLVPMAVLKLSGSGSGGQHLRPEETGWKLDSFCVVAVGDNKSDNESQYSQSGDHESVDSKGSSVTVLDYLDYTLTETTVIPYSPRSHSGSPFLFPLLSKKLHLKSCVSRESLQKIVAF
jgi:hypothetical protein